MFGDRTQLTDAYKTPSDDQPATFHALPVEDSNLTISGFKVHPLTI